MRTKALLKGDIGFQFKYGFYFLYLVFSVLYIGILFALPFEWREKAALLMVLTDPAAMGLYFMGAIILLEKSEKVLNSIAISPVKSREYVLSKLLSISIISTAVGLAIGIAGGVVSNLLYFSIGVFLASCLFSAVGLIIAANVSTLNAFIIATIPASLLINVPAIAYLFGFKKNWLILHPGVSMIELCSSGQNAIFAFLVLVFWTVLLAALSSRVVGKMLQAVGGVKL
ncbi:MAG: hypothetical protein APF84_15810 [Gracilibacter sp. BRH_c7a]|nr:MAG: hypothetical protein APF84_15810 [Gracilibacter sp. BRH_c7a]